MIRLLFSSQFSRPWPLRWDTDYCGMLSCNSLLWRILKRGDGVTPQLFVKYCFVVKTPVERALLSCLALGNGCLWSPETVTCWGSLGLWVVETRFSSGSGWLSAPGLCVLTLQSICCLITTLRSLNQHLLKQLLSAQPAGREAAVPLEMEDLCSSNFVSLSEWREHPWEFLWALKFSWLKWKQAWCEDPKRGRRNALYMCNTVQKCVGSLWWWLPPSCSKENGSGASPCGQHRPHMESIVNTPNIGISELFLFLEKNKKISNFYIIYWVYYVYDYGPIKLLPLTFS